MRGIATAISVLTRTLIRRPFRCLRSSHELHPTSIYYLRRRAGGGQWMAGRVVKHWNINGARYGTWYTMSHHYASAARPAWMPVGKSTPCRKAYRPTIIRSEPQGTFPDVKYRFSATRAALRPCPGKRRSARRGIIPRCRQRYCRREPGPCVGCQYCIAACPPTACAASIRSVRRR